MDAKLARERSQAKANNAKEWAQVELAIEQAVELGEFQAVYYGELSNYSMDKLKEQGYKLKKGGDIDRNSTILITW